MRLYEFIILLEYNRDITKKNFGDKILTQANKVDKEYYTTDIEPDKNKLLNNIFELLEHIDPTKHKQYVQWIIRQYLKGKFRLEDLGRIQDALEDYNKLKPRLPVEQRDINKFDLHQLEELVDNILNPELNKKDELDSTGTFPVVPNSEVLYNGPLGQLAIPKTEEASCELGRGTKWCTAARDDNYFDSYNRGGPLYIWRDRSGKKYQFYFSDPQFMNDKDQSLTKEEINYFRNENPVTSKLFKQKENEMLTSGNFDEDTLYDYADRVIQGRWPEAEEYIMKAPQVAYWYAKDVLHSPWPEAEPYHERLHICISLCQACN